MRKANIIRDIVTYTVKKGFANVFKIILGITILLLISFPIILFVYLFITQGSKWWIAGVFVYVIFFFCFLTAFLDGFLIY